MSELTRKTEQYEKRFGVIAVGMGLITAEQLVSALHDQVYEDLDTDNHRLLGEILRDMGFITAEQVEQVITKSLQLQRM